MSRTPVALAMRGSNVSNYKAPIDDKDLYDNKIVALKNAMNPKSWTK